MRIKREPDFFGNFLRCSPLLALSALLTWAITGGADQNPKSNSWSLVSPNKHCQVIVTLNGDGQLSYETWRNGKPVIQKSPLGLDRDDQNFEKALGLERAEPAYSQREKYQLFAGPQPKVNHLLNFRRLIFRNPNGARLEIDLAASDEGVAFRYRFPETNDAVRIVKSESTAFAMPTNTRGWLQPYHAAGPYTPAYEDYYFHVSPGDKPPDSRQKAAGWAFPALFHVPDADTWALLTESGTDGSYCGCHFSPDSTGSAYRIAFALADETTRGYTNKFGPEPRYILPWTMPWRVIVMRQEAGDIATETLVTDLAPPSCISETSWIKPGRASWAWWSYPDGPATTNLFNEFSDFAAKMGWEYTLFDAGWWRPGLEPIAGHALAEGVLPLVWSRAADFYDEHKRTENLDKMVAAGVRGVKVDFWCSDRQEAIAAQQDLMRDAAAHKLVVNLHGCTIPRGWQRTWPNFLSCEAVLGSETYYYDSHYTEKAAELDTVLPFTRNAVGPMDLTPIACSPRKYARTTTAAHQLAAAIIFTCGIVHYADQPEFFESLPHDALQIFRDAPARWDETRCLTGEPGKSAVFARRSGKSWFIAGINGTTNELPLTLDLSRYKKYPRRIVVTEGPDANMQVIAMPLKYSTGWQHSLPPKGGFILRLNR
jgi:alpha-glucosidase